ncbi:NADP-dependent malic enzyme [Desertibaculum subflavum]|uniref:NADP-dependent malic enzyme n=1 Tax=Desertibaculum subflavum TaxID=2268458 RepID=UPI000E66EA38
MTDSTREAALDYHRRPTPGKLAVTPTKRLANQHDLSLAYSPGVAAACEAIVADPAEAATLTARANLVAVVTNGTAVLGLGAIGPLAAKPVMEGKAVLFKKFAGIDVFDLEVAENDADRLVEVIAALEPTFGGINLEDIKAPECFVVEQKLRQRMKIPVMHDDQHGTAICVAAAVKNGLRVVGKELPEITAVCCGAGAAALACLDQLVELGLDKAKLYVVDLAGVVYEGRAELMDPFKARYARKTGFRSLGDVIDGADLFLGLSGPNVLKPDMLKRMAPRPLVLALANPTPEIDPKLAREARPDAVIATGRSDFPNQVNNVLCFPFLFRGALDVGATQINGEMKRAAVDAISDLALAESSDIVAKAYGGEGAFAFGPEYLIPKPFDPRLILRIAPAVAEAAMRSGVATRPIADMEAYRQSLGRFVYRTGFVMKPVFDRARAAPARVVYAEGENETVIRAAQIVVDEKLARPVLIGREDALARRMKELGIRLLPGRDVEILDPRTYAARAEFADAYHRMMARNGVLADAARITLRSDATVIAAMMVKRGEADAMICGTLGEYDHHLPKVRDILGLRPGAQELAALQLLVLPNHTLFLTDTNVADDPSPEALARIAVMAAAEVGRFGLEPKLAVVSHSNFGGSAKPSADKMRRVVELIRAEAPALEVDGEMKPDLAINLARRDWIFPYSTLSGAANLLIMPTVDAANIAFNLAKEVAEGFSVGPMLLGLNAAAHVVTPAISVRGLVNMTAVAVVDAQDLQARGG